MKSYCVKQKKKQTECVEPSGTATAKNGRKYFTQNVELKKQDSLRETKSAPSRRGHFGVSSINWG